MYSKKITDVTVRVGKIILVLVGIIVIGTLVWQGITASGVPDPTLPHLDRGAVILNSGLLVFREGLEAILVLAAITASFVGKNQPYRRPIAIGSALGFLASVVTWFVAIAIIKAVAAPALYIQAVTGVIAIIVLLVIMNWFFHKIYWTGWISLHNRRRRQIMADADSKTENNEANKAAQSRTSVGLMILGLSAVYREGFEIVLFLQNLRLQSGSGVVLEGVAIGLVFTLAVGALTFLAHHRLPYKKMLIVTGVLLGMVLVVMVGESAQELQQAGWLSATQLNFPIPGWMGVWFAIFPNIESLSAQLLAAIFVIGSYVAAQYVRVWRPRAQARLVSSTSSAQ
jgi:high-affinity iron transporter